MEKIQNNHKNHGPVLPQNMLAQVSNEMVIGEKSKEFGKKNDK